MTNSPFFYFGASVAMGAWIDATAVLEGWIMGQAGLVMA
jgi:hypothetical protein